MGKGAEAKNIVNSEYVDELRECAWIAYKGYFSCKTASELSELDIRNQFLVNTQQNAYMCGVLWWASLFGLKSGSYQFNRNHRRDFRLICNRQHKEYPKFSGNRIDSRLKLAAGITQSEYEALRARLNEMRNSKFAHVNPEEESFAFSLEPCAAMFMCCIETVNDFYDDIVQKYPELHSDITRSKQLIENHLSVTQSDHNDFIIVLKKTWNR